MRNVGGRHKRNSSVNLSVKSRKPDPPGWKPNPDSAVVRRTVAVYQRLFGERPAIKAVHAGLECGILTQKIPGLDAVSIGPEIRNAHSPDEKARISSAAKFYSLLGELLADLAGS